MRRLSGLVLALLMLGGAASCARDGTADAAANTPPEARHVDAMMGAPARSDKAGLSSKDAAEVMWPDGKESGKLTVMAVRAAEGELWAPRQRPGVQAEPLAGDSILVVYLDDKPIHRSSFTWSADARAADWLPTLTTVPAR